MYLVRVLRYVVLEFTRIYGFHSATDGVFDRPSSDLYIILACYLVSQKGILQAMVSVITGYIEISSGKFLILYATRCRFSPRMQSCFLSCGSLLICM